MPVFEWKGMALGLGCLLSSLPCYASFDDRGARPDRLYEESQLDEDNANAEFFEHDPCAISFIYEGVKQERRFGAREGEGDQPLALSCAYMAFFIRGCFLPFSCKDCRADLAEGGAFCCSI